MKGMSNMSAERIVEILLDPGLIEATVRRPPRSKRWVAVFTGPEPGKQVWRTTGLTNRDAAMALARKWEAEARRDRATSGVLTRKPTIRVRPGSGEAAVGLLTQKEVAAILGLSVRAIREIERRAFEKLRRALRRYWREYGTGNVEENVAPGALDRPQIAALFGLTRTPLERRALRKLLVAILTDRLPEI